MLGLPDTDLILNTEAEHKDHDGLTYLTGKPLVQFHSQVQAKMTHEPSLQCLHYYLLITDYLVFDSCCNSSLMVVVDQNCGVSYHPDHQM